MVIKEILTTARRVNTYSKMELRRNHRGLFVSSEGKQINADVNGSYNIIRKCRPEAFADGVGAVVVQPRVIKTLN